MRTVLVTGGAGFIGVNLLRRWSQLGAFRFVVLDKLTYAANPAVLQPEIDRGRVELIQGDIADSELVEQLLLRTQPSWVLNLAAESHVDRSIDSPAPFVQTNILGTFGLLEATRRYLRSADSSAAGKGFRMLHVSTDEVFGSAAAEESFSEIAAYRPSSPYAASKAAADHLVRSFHTTYGTPLLLTNASNNYGPHQFPEKFIPVMISQALAGEPLPIYGDGAQQREWTHVDDHADALLSVLLRGKLGETYNVGSGEVISNLELAIQLLAQLAELGALPPRDSSSDPSRNPPLVHVADRPGHDRCYRLCSAKLRTELGWQPQHTLRSGLAETVAWYVENRQWLTARLQAVGGHRRRGSASGASASGKAS
ncbi:dTDP-glucose 4,6-dehydratase [Planctomycetaceae bacterium SH139]